MSIKFADCIGKCEYFTVEKYEIDGEKEMFVDEKSFQCITCVKGNGFDGIEIKQGDNCFISAGFSVYKLIGVRKVILTKI